MTAGKVELLGRDKIRIGERTLHMYYRDPPLVDGITYDVETSTDDKRYPESQLEPHELRGVCLSDLPDGFLLSIYAIDKIGPDFRRFSNVRYRRIASTYEIELDYNLYFADWEHSVNLRHFADRFAKRLVALDPDSIRADVRESEVGVYVFVNRSLRANDDCFKSFRRLLDEIRAEYLRAVQDMSQDRDLPITTDSAVADKSRWQWWTQYVVVPIGIAVIGLIALLLSG